MSKSINTLREAVDKSAVIQADREQDLDKKIEYFER
jgi:hypothetical protein